MTPGIHELAADLYHADPCDRPSLSASRVVWRHGHEEVDLTPLMVGKVEREIGIGNWPTTKVTFHAILVEHHPEPTS